MSDKIDNQSPIDNTIEDWVPLNGHIVVEIFKESERSGIIIPASIQDNKFTGRVISICAETDPEKPIRVKVGQIVYFGWGGSKLEKVVNSDKFMLVPYDKILMVRDSNKE